MATFIIKDAGGAALARFPTTDEQRVGKVSVDGVQALPTHDILGVAVPRGVTRSTRRIQGHVLLLPRNFQGSIELTGTATPSRRTSKPSGGSDDD